MCSVVRPALINTGSLLRCASGYDILTTMGFVEVLVCNSPRSAIVPRLCKLTRWQSGSALISTVVTRRTFNLAVFWIELRYNSPVREKEWRESNDRSRKQDRVINDATLGGRNGTLTIETAYLNFFICECSITG